jgi:hypothetical protein
LERWWSSARCQRKGTWQEATDAWTDARLHYVTIAADGHGIWVTTPPGTRDDLNGEPTDRSTDAGMRVRVPFFVEVDLATEDLPRLVGKLDAYQSWRKITGRTWPVLYWLTSAARETHLHDRLRDHPSPVPVATAVHDPTATPGTGPADRVWRLHRAAHWLGHPPKTGRLTLADLATVTDPLPGHRPPDG